MTQLVAIAKAYQIDLIWLLPALMTIVTTPRPKLRLLPVLGE